MFALKNILQIFDIAVFIIALILPIYLVMKFDFRGIIFAGPSSALIICLRPLLGWIISGGTSFFGPGAIFLIYGSFYTIMFTFYSYIAWLFANGLKRMLNKSK